MTTHAQGIAENKSWDEKPYEEREGGGKLTKASVVQTLTGDIEGEAATEFVMVYPDAKSASYVGMVVVTGTLGGKKGSFVLQCTGSYAESVASGAWFVVPGSGTGDLKKLRGEGGFRAPEGSKMNYTLDYELA